MIHFDFSGQTAIVTGGTRGIGAAVSAALLRAGATVIATYAGNHQAAEAFAAAQGDAAQRLELRSFDISDYSQAEAFFKEFDRLHSRLDILVNCAGIRDDSVLAMMPPTAWQRVLEVNLNGAYNIAKLGVLRMMQNRYGRIVFLTSPVGRIGFAGQANYAASKAGLVAMCRSLSKELAKRKITANCVSQALLTLSLLVICRRNNSRNIKIWCP